MNKASATSSPEPNKTEKMLLMAKNYWDYTTQPIVFVAPTMEMAADIRNRFLRLMESCVDVLENPRRVRCLSLCEPDGLKNLMGGRNAAFFFDHTCFERSDLLEAAGKLVSAIWGNHLGEVVTAADDGWGIGRNAAAFTFKIPSSDLGLISSEAVEGFKRAAKGSPDDLPRRRWTTETEGGATVPCPWEREGGRETFYPAAKNEDHGLDRAVIQRASKQAADAVARLVDLRPRHEFDRLRTADILQAMTMRNATDRAIPEEWMDELSDLVWRERDRLEGNTED